MTAFRLKKLEPKESDIQSAVIRALRVHPAVVWAERMNSAAGHLTHPNGTSRFMRFGFRGMPDIMGQVVGGKALYIEVKRPSGVVSPEQKAFLQKAEKHGAVAFVARSVSDVWSVLDTVTRGANDAAPSSVR